MTAQDVHEVIHKNVGCIDTLSTSVLKNHNFSAPSVITEQNEKAV